MTVAQRIRVSDLGLSGPVRQNAAIITTGFLNLVAGTAQEPVGTFSDHGNAPTVLVSRFSAGGTVGHLTASLLAGLLTITSSSGTDTSTVHYAVIG